MQANSLGQLKNEAHMQVKQKVACSRMLCIIGQLVNERVYHFHVKAGTLFVNFMSMEILSLPSINISPNLNTTI